MDASAIMQNDARTENIRAMWGSWANMQKLSSQQWPFQLFYWDYCLGVLLLTVLLRCRWEACGPVDVSLFRTYARHRAPTSAMPCLAASSSTSPTSCSSRRSTLPGLSVAFPIGIGLALVIGVITTYLVETIG